MHEPVMVTETLEWLDPGRGGLFVDCTVGLGGHAQALLRGGATRLIGLDRDSSALERAKENVALWSDRVELVHSDYRHLDNVLLTRGVTKVDGLLIDMGLSSMQLETPGRGFSFQRDEALDMRMDQSNGNTAAEILREADTTTLANVIHEFGEERYARRIARGIVRARANDSIETTGQLAAIVRRAIPYRGHTRIDPATRTFQAIRIWVNSELEELDNFLEMAVQKLSVGARLVAITFHSLEDRIVKHKFRALQEGSKVRLRVLTKRPLVPGEEESRRNPRSRSAKFRVIERI